MKRKLRVGEGYVLSNCKLRQYYIRIFSLLAVLTTMCLYAVKQVSAQVAEPAATADIKPLQIGDTIPEALWHLPLQVVNHPEGKDTVTLNGYRGKLIILDFWATWCGSCIANMPKAHQLVEQFEDDLVIIPSTYEDADKVRSFWASNKYTKDLPLFSVVENEWLARVFPHRIIPHYIWISPNGGVEAFSAGDELQEDNVVSVLEGVRRPIRPKHDVDTSVPLFLNRELLLGNTLAYHAVLIGGRHEGMPSGPKIQYDESGREIGIALTNATLLRMYEYCARKLFRQDGNDFYSRKKLVLEISSQPESLDSLYSLSLTLPPSQFGNVYREMMETLNKYTAYTAAIEKMEQKCLVLKHTGTADKFQSKDTSRENTLFKKKVGRMKGFPISYLIAAINSKVLSDSSQFLVNGTSYKGLVDVTLSTDARLGIASMNKELRAYGLEIVEKTREVDMLLIRDTVDM